MSGIYISDAVVASPLPGIACLRRTGVAFIEIDADGSIITEITLGGTITDQIVITGSWQRCPDKDNSV